MQIKMKTFGLVQAADAPKSPNCGCKFFGTLIKNLPAGTAAAFLIAGLPNLYAPWKYRVAMAILVYSIPVTPTRENGAKDDKFFSRHSGSSVVPVIPNNAVVLVMSIPVAVTKRAKK